MPDTERPAADDDTALLGCALILAMADFRITRGSDTDGSQTVAHVVGRVGDLARIAPLVRFRDTAEAEDPSGAQLKALHGKLKRLAPLMSRLARRAE